MGDVLDYMDYQLYLRDFYENAKAHRYFSYRYMGQKVGLDAGFLVRVIQGKAHLSPKSIPAFTNLCGFTDKQAQYFNALVRYGKATSASDIKHYLEDLLFIRGVSAEVLETSQYAFYQQWYHSAIHAMLTFREFSGDYAWLARSLTPRISVKEAKSSIALLAKIGLIAKDQSGAYRATKATVSTGEKWKTAAVREFQRSTIRLADESLDRHEKCIRDISTVTISVSRHELPAIKEAIRECRQTILRISSSGKQADSVYQVNFQVFPLALPEEGQS